MPFANLQSPFSPGKRTVEAFTLPSVLPHDVHALKTLLVTQQSAFDAAVAAIHKEAHDYVTRILEQAILARQRMFGASSEQLRAQGRLFDEAESLAHTSTEAQDTAPPGATATRPPIRSIGHTHTHSHSPSQGRAWQALCVGNRLASGRCGA
jgi:cell wall-associated NlpC family hydrolase